MKKSIVFAMLIAAAVPMAAFADGAATYKAKCAMCHGPDGAGQTAMGKNLKLRNLASADVQKQTDAELTKIVSDGKGKMPAQKTLSADDVKAVVAFVRSLKK